MRGSGEIEPDARQSAGTRHEYEITRTHDQDETIHESPTRNFSDPCLPLSSSSTSANFQSTKEQMPSTYVYAQSNKNDQNSSPPTTGYELTTTQKTAKSSRDLCQGPGSKTQAVPWRPIGGAGVFVFPISACVSLRPIQYEWAHPLGQVA